MQKWYCWLVVQLVTQLKFKIHEGINTEFEWILFKETPNPDDVTVCGLTMPGTFKINLKSFVKLDVFSFYFDNNHNGHFSDFFKYLNTKARAK